MRRQVEPSLLADLSAAQNVADQVAVLREIKNLLVGHDLRKVEWIGHGILPVLADLLSTKGRRSGKQAGPGLRIQRTTSDKNPASDEEEAVFLQATGILCIIAKGGSAFVEPILYSDILAQLVSALSSDTCSSRITLGILRCLNVLVDHLPPSAPTNWLPNQQLASLLYSSEYVACWPRIITQTNSSSTAEQVSTLAASLIWKTCAEEKHKRALSQAEILPALAHRIAAHVVAQGLVLPVPDAASADPSIPREIPSAASPSACIGPILACLALLLDGSKVRIEEYLAATDIAAVFPRPQNYKPQSKKSPWARQSSSSWSSRSQNPIDSLLPHLPYPQPEKPTEHTNFPPLGTTSSAQRQRSSLLALDFINEAQVRDSDDTIESPFISWLVYLVRTGTGFSRVMAAKVLVTLFKQGFTKKSRVSDCCAIVVPALLQFIDRSSDGKKLPNTIVNTLDGLGTFTLLEEAPATLADLVMDDPDLQKAAVDAHAIKPLCMALKETFAHTSDAEVAMWWPDTAARLAQDKSAPVRTIGNKGPSQYLRHTMRYREGVLKALASLAPFNDEYRKAICEQGVLPLIIDSLKPMVLTSQSTPGESSNFYPSSGNPAAVLLAACSVIRALTRSVSALRTNLIDAGVAAPILKLLKNADPEIRIAATKVVGNLAMDFSPMKETVGHSSVIKTLCEHAHSANPRLRFESIWSLKQLVVNSTNPLKMSVIQELGPSWMKQLISTDPADIPSGVVIGLIDLDFPSRRQIYQGGEDVEMGDLADAYADSHDNNRYTMSDDDPNRHTVEDDTAIQEQLLDLIRNLFCGEKASDIIEYILTEMGHKDFFDVLLARLRPRTIPGHTRKENKLIQPPTGIIIKVMYIIVHMSASLSKYRNLVAANGNLMREVLKYTTHPNREVRAQCCWISINLTYEDDPSDHAACKHRAADLQRVGYFQKLVAMEHDVELDVRERQKTACHIIRQLLS
jgi:armadillo repeat-containing protein 8